MYQTLACHGRAPQPWQVVGVIDHVRLITFEVSVCVVEPAFVNRQLRQGIMDPKQLAVPVGRRGEFESRFEMLNGLPYLALGSIYFAKETVRSAEAKWIAFLRDKAGTCGKWLPLWRVELLVFE